MGHRKGDPRPDEQVHIEPEELESFILAAYGRSKMPKCDMSDPVAVAERYDWYVQSCITNNSRPGVAGLASAFGYERKYFLRMKDGEVKSVPEESRDTLKRAWIMFEDLLEQYMLTGKINPIPGIFLLKNNHGYKDQSEQVIIKRDPYESGNPEEIARRYLSGMAPALDAPPEIARTDAPLVETVVVDQTGTVE